MNSRIIRAATLINPCPMETTLKRYALLILITIGITLSQPELFAQSIAIISQKTNILENKKEHFSRDTSATITLYASGLSEGTVFLRWNTAGQRSNGLYIIYRSSDGEGYEVIGYRKGTGVPIESEIAYYFADESPCSGTNYYGIVHIGYNQTYLASEIIRVENKDQLYNSIVSLDK